MKILLSSQIREVDNYTIKNEPILSVDLMERAALACTDWIDDHYDDYTPFKIFTGPGNNGGDGLAIARLLSDLNYPVDVFQVKISDHLSIDSKINLKRLKEQNKVRIHSIEKDQDFPSFQSNDIIIDSLFGSGLKRTLDGFPRSFVQHLNSSGNQIISIDIPSGLFGEDNSKNVKDAIIQATYTLTFEIPKLAFFFPENEIFVGEWHVLSIGLHQEFIKSLESSYLFIDREMVKQNLMSRKTFSHKGTYGHGLLISGSYGKMGAAVLGSRASLRTGIGLQTTHVPLKGYEILQNAVPEAMVSIDKSENIFTTLPDLESFSAIAIGPGIGQDNLTTGTLNELIRKCQVPMVLDADALNILSNNKHWFEDLPPESILTPHPKEFERLSGIKQVNYQTLPEIRAFSVKNNIYLVLKGAYTIVSCPDGNIFFNSTGNAGMATAGSGDVLTGIILSLLSQGYSPKWTAITGIYIHGLAGDIAVEATGQESLIASDIIDHLGIAFKKLKNDSTC